MCHTVDIGPIRVGAGNPLALICGPCVIESRDTSREIARFLKDLASRLELPLIFKASFDKANRTSIRSYRGPGIEEGLSILSEIREEFGLPVLSDVHTEAQIPAAALALDVLQIPAFLCRQTDFIQAVAKAGRPVNVKKGQFLSPWDMKNVVEKMAAVGNRQVLLTERGSSFGYHNLVVDFRSIPIMRKETGMPVVFDATHSVQLPGGDGVRSGGRRDFAPLLAQAAVAAGADAIFMEVHPDPDRALCDGPNSLALDTLPELWTRLQRIRTAMQ